MKPLLVEFLGCPHSGKTSLAVKLFDRFKDDGLITEFITEEARKYIAEQRFAQKLLWNAPLELTLIDQRMIMGRQIERENTFCQTTAPGAIIVSDSSPLNTLLYMEHWDSYKGLLQQHLNEHSPLLFWSKAVTKYWINDPNRVHDKKQSLKVEQRIPELIEEFGINVIEIDGERTSRFNQCLEVIIEKMTDGTADTEGQPLDSKDPELQ